MSLINARIRHKRDTASNWSSRNPVLLAGEIIVVETGDGYTRLKIGDGTSNYAQLPFTDEDLVNQIAELESTLSSVSATRVTGPESSTNNHVAIFDGATGKLVKDSGFTLGVSVPANAKFTDTTYSTGNTTTAGITKLYTSTGTATDGAMTQSATKTALDLKAPLASPTFTGTPKAPTAAVGTNTTQIATTAFVSSSIAALVDSAPETLNTLGELATALQENVEVTEALNNAIGSKAPIDSPNLTGTPTAPTATDGNNSTQIATTAFVMNALGSASVSLSRGQVTVSANETSSINIPVTITDTSKLIVYQEGLLLAPTTHYTATTSKITLVGYTASAGEIFDFIYLG